MEISDLPSPRVAKRANTAEDQQLVTRLKAGDTGAFDRLVCAHQERVARLVVRLLGKDAEINDLMQEIFLSVYVGIKRFRQESRFSTWLTTIAINKCRSYARKQQRRRRLLGWLRWARPHYRDNIDPRTNDALEQLKEAVYRLPMSLREPLVLRYFEELSVDEIGKVLNISPGAVEVRLSRARQKLKEILSSK
jgi:RNA polymerase sigma factor (sigma-70 family)